MKKILSIVIMCLMIIGCTSNNNENTIPHKPFKKYEVLLLTKDTIYVDAYRYNTWDDSGMFSGGNNITYEFKDDYYHTIMEIQNPVYVKEIK